MDPTDRPILVPPHTQRANRINLRPDNGYIRRDRGDIGDDLAGFKIEVFRIAGIVAQPDRVKPRLVPIGPIDAQNFSPASGDTCASGGSMG